MKDEIRALIDAMGQHPDPLHVDRTPAVEALIKRGEEVLPAVLPLLDSGDADMRMRAQRILAAVTRDMFDAEQQDGPLERGAMLRWQSLWDENGGYDWRASESDRRESLRRWTEWLRARGR